MTPSAVRSRRRPIALLAAGVLSIAALLAPSPAGAWTLNLNAAGRTDTDKDRDSYNKPAQLLEFWGIAGGMQVMDLFPGDGYLTLLLSQAVGPKGKVMAYASYDQKGFDKRMQPLALANVEQMVLTEEVGFKQLHTYLAKLPAASLDAVVTIRNYHDIANPAEVLAELKRVLKPGGTLGIADARTTSGRDIPTHRIADDVIIREVTAAGFTLAGTSQMLSNPKDDDTRTYWDARYVVDQSCLRFTR